MVKVQALARIAETVIVAALTHLSIRLVDRYMTPADEEEDSDDADQEPGDSPRIERP